MEENEGGLEETIVDNDETVGNVEIEQEVVTEEQSTENSRENCYLLLRDL